MVDRSQHDVILGLTGASAALGGLVLVFLGVVVAAYQPLIGVASDTTLGKFKNAGLAALAVFLVSLASLILDVAWLVATGGHRLYVAAVVLFFVQIATLVALAWFSTIHVLLKG
jgi:O-antigen ligase